MEENSYRRGKTFELTKTNERCWKCGEEMFRMKPTYYRWEYYCDRCKHATQTISELKEAVKEAAEQGAIGTVAAVSINITLIRQRMEEI